MNTRRTAFTLVELLVVIAIIAVLISVLVPALGRAKYRANLIQCLANERMLGVAVIGYGSDFKGWYPYRSLGAVGTGGAYSMMPCNYSDAGLGFDDRPLFKTFMPNITQMLNCPLSPLAAGMTLERTATQTQGTRELWFGTGNNFNQTGSGMLRVGDRPRYTTGGSTYTFNVLVSDLERDWVDYVLLTAHQDDNNTLQRQEVYNSVATISNWLHFSPPDYRATLDRNFLFDDGSARGMHLAFRDPATIRVPFGSYFPASGWPVYGWLPPMQ